MRLPESQKGAAALFAAVGLLGMLAAAAFAVDMAQLYITKRELQNMANLAALDSARAAGGCLAPDEDRQAEANGAALSSLGRHGGESQWLVGNRVSLGRFIITGNNLRQFQQVGEEEARESYAFEVQLQRPFPDLIMPMPNIDTSSAVLRARGVAAMAPVASFEVGSFLFSVGPADQQLLNSVLSEALGSPLSLGILSYQGLVDSSVTLEEVADSLGETLPDFLDGPIELPGLLSALAAVLFANGETVAAAAVDTIAASAPNEQVVPGQVIGTPQDTVIGTGQIALNSLSLVQAMVMSSGGAVLELTPSVTIPGVAGVGVGVSLGQLPQPAAGPATQDAVQNYMTRASNTQGVVDLELQLLPLLGNPLAVDLRLEVAAAEGELTEIRCAGRNRSQHEVDIGVQTRLARLSVNNGPSNPLINLPAFPGLGVCWQGSIDFSDEQYSLLSFTGPFHPTDPAIVAANTRTVGTDMTTSLSTALADLLLDSPPGVCAGSPSGPLVDLVVNPVLAALATTLGPTLAGTVDPLLMPTLRSLGIHVGGADVLVRDVYVQPPALIISEE